MRDSSGCNPPMAALDRSNPWTKRSIKAPDPTRQPLELSQLHHAVPPKGNILGREQPLFLNQSERSATLFEITVIFIVTLIVLTCRDSPQGPTRMRECLALAMSISQCIPGRSGGPE